MRDLYACLSEREQKKAAGRIKRRNTMIQMLIPLTLYVYRCRHLQTYLQMPDLLLYAMPEPRPSHLRVLFGNVSQATTRLEHSATFFIPLSTHPLTKSEKNAKI